MLCLFAVTIQAQLCTGSLSDPIVSIDFGQSNTVNNQYGPPLPDGITTYSYLADIISDGEYTIGNNLTLGRPGWHNTPDHTNGDTGGYMFIVNASFEEGEFYRSRVEGLCENTLFEFSAFAINAYQLGGVCGDGIDPNLRFEIRTPSGALLASEESGDISATTSPLWQQYGLTFNSGTNTEVDVIIINNAPGGCGNDLAIDDIEFRACGDIAEIDAEVNVNEICPNNIPDQIQLFAELQGDVYDQPVYQWQEYNNGNWQDISGATLPSYTIEPITEGEQYRFKVANTIANLNNENCAVVSDGATVAFAPESSFQITGETSYCDGDDLELSVSGNQDIELVQWNTPAGMLQGETYTLTNINTSLSGEYFAEITDVFGCVYEEQVTVEIAEHTEETLFYQECEGENITLPNGETYTVSEDDNFDVIIPNENLCDSIINISITSYPVYNQIIDTIVCKNTQISAPGGDLLTLEQDTILNYSFQSLNNCDSLVEKRITVPQDVNTIETACMGEEIILPDQTVISATESFSQTYSLPSSTDCDSVINYQLMVFPQYEVFDTIITCPIVPLSLGNYGEINDEGTYPVIFNSINNCDSVVNYVVEQQIDSCDFNLICQLQYPNAISPNADGVNDVFRPNFYSDCNYENYTLQIWNRWGELIFETHTLSDYWFPKTNQRGNFVYSVNYNILLPEGGKSSQSASGTITVIN